MSLSICLDKSGSIIYEFEDVKESARKFVDLMDINDELGLITFSNSPEELSNLTQTTLTNKMVLKSKIDDLEINLFEILTALYDSIGRAVEQVKAGSLDRRAIIALTDGGDTSSTRFTSKEEIISFARSYNIPVYTVGLGLGSGSPNELVLEEIAKNTGGIYYNAPTSGELSNIYAKISSALNSYYVIEIESPIPLYTGQVYIIDLFIKNYGEISDNYSFTVEI